MTVLPFRWQAAASMWQRGYPVSEIAAIYQVPITDLKRRLGYLKNLYPDHFPERRGRLKLVIVPQGPRRRRRATARA